VLLKVDVISGDPSTPMVGGDTWQSDSFDCLLSGRETTTFLHVGTAVSGATPGVNSVTYVECSSPFATDGPFADNKIVSTRAANDVTSSQALLQAFTGNPQQFIARFVAKLVIDLFEIVKIDKKQRAGRIIVACGEPLGSVPFEATSIQNPGQWIGGGNRFHMLLLRLAVRDVNKRHGKVIAHRFTDHAKPAFHSPLRLSNLGFDAVALQRSQLEALQDVRRSVFFHVVRCDSYEIRCHTIDEIIDIPVKESACRLVGENAAQHLAALLMLAPAESNNAVDRVIDDRA